MQDGENPGMSSEKDRVRRRVRVQGRVQGVFFRDSTREQAEAEDVAGWVTNNSDGSVEAVLEGPPDAVERVIAHMKQGPDRASVEDVEVADEAPQGETGFSVR
jgi:acylphosphatase